jgi:hypothetical protein
MRKWWWNISVLLFITLAGAGCSERYGTPVYSSDSTLVYAPVDTTDITANIIFYRKRENKTGKLIREGTVFTPVEKGNIRALIMLQNRQQNTHNALMFHLDWIGTDQHSFYRKQIILPADDTSTFLQSSVSLDPALRQPGDYKLKVYLFRELIAEKKFTLLPEFRLTKTPDDEIKADITLYRKRSRKTGKLIGKGTVFNIKEKRHVRADIRLENRFAYGNRELLLYFVWSGPDGNVFYHKKVDLPPGDSTTGFHSSVSIAPEKREPGTYKLSVFIYKELIGEERFELK